MLLWSSASTVTELQRSINKSTVLYWVLSVGKLPDILREQKLSCVHLDMFLTTTSNDIKKPLKPMHIWDGWGGVWGCGYHFTYQSKQITSRVVLDGELLCSCLTSDLENTLTQSSKRFQEIKSGPPVHLKLPYLQSFLSKSWSPTSQLYLPSSRFFYNKRLCLS